MYLPQSEDQSYFILALNPELSMLFSKCPFSTLLPSVLYYIGECSVD